MSNSIHEFYTTPRATTESDGPTRSVYEIWERGEAFNDSVTPSSYCPEYRTHMVLKILSLCKEHDKVFSIGCGNAFVEAGLQARGLRVQAIDCNAEAVELAAAKGVEAFTADYSKLPAGHLAAFSAVYADGLLGHFYRPESGLDRFFEQLIALKPRPGSWLVFSNDAPLQQEGGVAPHPRLADFWMLSRAYLAETVARFGFKLSESYHFPYERPLSGLRNRTICIAQIPPDAAAE